MQNEPNVKRKKEEFNKVSGPLPNQQSSNIDEQQTKEEQLDNLRECMALNSASTSSDSDSEVSEVDSFLIDGALSGSGSGSDLEPEPEYLLSQVAPPDLLQEPGARGDLLPGDQEAVDQETQARLEALLEAAGISRLSGETKQLADPEILRRLTSSVSSALDEAAAALTRMRAEPSQDSGRSLVAACSEGDIGRVRRLLDEGRVSVHETTEEGESLLSLACSAGYYELAQVLLAMRANVEDRGMKGDCTPLMEAASAGHTDIVRLLIAHGADVNAQSSSGNTPLMYACAGGHEDVVRVLLEAGAHVEDHNENGHTPLMEAASAGHCTVARILLEFGAGINTHSNEFKESALTLACYKGHLEMVRFLLEAGADQEHKTDEMHTALMEASMDGHVEVARLLLDSGAQVNMPADSFESPLTLAACGGHVELAMLLLERGANIEEVNDEGYTPLMEASREGHEEMVALLLSQGADINAQTEETQETALTLACCGGFLEVADFLIKAGADLELGASTPLMESSQEGHLELVRYLLEAGASVNAITGTGDTALTYACENGHTDVADLLLQYGAQLEHESEGGRTPLMKAARAGHLCTVQFLISRGADVNKQTTNNDHTPLSLACAGGHLNVVEVLLQQGADPYHKLKDNSTMLIEAAKGGHTNVVQILIDYPNSLVTSGIMEAAAAAQGQPPAQLTGLTQPPEPGRQAAPGAETEDKGGYKKVQRTKEAGAALPYLDYPDILEGSGFVLEGLEEKGLDAKTYIQTMLRRTEGSSKEEQIYQKEQILAELQRVEKELQEKAAAQLLPGKREAGDGGEFAASERQDRHKREAGDGVETEAGPAPAVKEDRQGVAATSPQTSTSPSDQAAAVAESVVQNISSLSLAGRSLANIPPSERPKAKPSRKIDGKGAKKSQLQAALQQHSQQLAQLQQLQQLNQQLQQQVQQQRQLKQQNQATLAALQQNAVHNQQQLADLQRNVTQLQQLEQTILAQQSTPHNQQQQLQQRVQQILQQKQQLQQQIKQFQQQVEQQLAYTQHASPQLLAGGPAQLGPATPGAAATTTASGVKNGGATPLAAVEGVAVSEGALVPQEPGPPTQFSLDTVAGEAGPTICGTDLNFLMSADQLQGFIQGPGGLPAGIDPSLLTSAAFELVQASQALQAVQAVQPLLASDSPPLMTPLTQDPGLLSAMDPATIARAVQHCPIPLDTALQVATSAGGQVALQYNAAALQATNGVLTNLAGVPPSAADLAAAGQTGPILTDCSQHASQSSQPITNFGHQLLLQPQFAFGPGNGLPVLDAAGNNIAGDIAANPAAYGLQLPAGTDLSHLGFPAAAGTAGVQLPGANGADPQLPPDKKKSGKKKGQGNTAPAGTSVSAQLAAGIQATAGLLDNAGYAGHYVGNGYAQTAQTAGYATAAGQAGQPAQLQPGQQAAAGQPGQTAAGPVVDLDSETDSNHDTALTLACAGGHEELVNLLLSRGADIEHRDKKGFTPLILAATAGHDKVVEILINHGADIEAQSERTKDTPLSLACSGGRYEVVEILLSRGSNKEHRNVSDYTPLSLAASGGYTNIIKLLLAHGAEINSRTGSKLGISPLMLAAMNGHTAAVKLLLDMGSDINAQIETNRNTALTLACFQGRHEVVSLLLDRKANVEHRAKTGLTPLMEAASGGYTEVGRVLLDKGADVNAAPVPSSRDTALTIAADKGHYRFVELLLSRGAQVDVRNKKGNSSLWLAANGGHLDVVQLLYSAGADIDSQDNRKVSCLMAAFRKGHSKVVKWLVKHVTQFPSDTELTRFIATISDKDMIKKTHQCLEIIRIAKERQASEANKAASILLEELEQEKTREESKKAAAARKREKKKKKKEERKAEKQTKDDDDADMDEDDMMRDANGDANTEDEKEKTPEIIAEGDSGIDANSQGSGASNDKDEKENEGKSNKKKKNKKKKDNKNNERNERETNKENENDNNVGVTRGDSKEKSPDDEDPADSRSDRSSQPRVPCTIEGHSVLNVSPPESDKDKNKATTETGFIEPQGRKRANRAAKQADTVLTEANKTQPGQAGGKTKGGSTVVGAKVPPTDAGWKEVVRKSKKVSVPSNAISRVIGRGGSNINAIRELSGAHIEVEKQSKGQGDRTILIKGSADATRLANQWISAIIASPDKDLVDIVGRQQYKQLSSQAAASKATAAVTKAATKTTAVVSTASSKVKTTAETGKVKLGQAVATAASISSSTKTSVSFSGPVMTAKTKPVSSTSFAAIAAGNENNFGIIPTGPPPVKANMTGPSKGQQPGFGNSSAAASKQQQQMKKMMEEQQQGGNNIGAQPLMGANNSVGDNKDFSPFKTFKMPGNLVNWGMMADSGKPGTAQDTFKGFPGGTGEPELAKAPGYRNQTQTISPGSGLGQTATTSSNWAGSSAAPGAKKPQTGDMSHASGQPDQAGLYSQERCSSAPGTPVSPVVPSPIAPPAPVSGSSGPGKQLAPGPPGPASNSSPGSEPDWFRGQQQQQPGQQLGPASVSNLRSMTPDGDFGWGQIRSDDLDSGPRRHGTGSYGHNSPAKAPGAPLPDLFGRMNINKVDPTTGLATENLLNAAAQLSNLSNNYDMMTVTSSIAPGIPLPDNTTPFSAGAGFVGSGSSRFGPGTFSTGGSGGRFSQPVLTTSINTTGFSSQPQVPSMPIPSAAVLSAKAPGAGAPNLNPNAPDFGRGVGMFGVAQSTIRPPASIQPSLTRPGQNIQQPKIGTTGGFGFSNYGGVGAGNNYNNFNNQSGGNLQSLLTNQSINALMSNYNLGSAPPVDISTMGGLNDFSGRTLSELTDLLGPDSLPGYQPPADLEPKFSRPIGAERRTGPSPIGQNLTGQPPSRPKEAISNPFGVWDLPPSYNPAEANSNNDTGMGFNLLPPSMSGHSLQQTLFDNIPKGGFSDLQYNGGGVTGGAGGHTGGGGHDLLQPPTSGGFGLSPSLTPSKNNVDYSDWGSASGSAPSSGTKINDPVGFRGDPATVRRNMNAMWPKEWEG